MNKQDCLPNAVWPVMLKRATHENKNCKCQAQSNEIEICFLSLLLRLESDKYHQAFASGSAVNLSFIAAAFLIRFVMFERLKSKLNGKTKLNKILNSVRQHNHFITEGNYIGYVFRL